MDGRERTFLALMAGLIWELPGETSGGNEQGATAPAEELVARFVPQTLRVCGAVTSGLLVSLSQTWNSGHLTR